MLKVNDGPRILQFEGEEIGFSTSERPGAARWIEFTLYKTAGDGQYVLSRVGPSNVYHTPGCRFSTRKHLEPVPWSALAEGAVPCHRVPDVIDGCRPVEDEFPLVCIEDDETWARVYQTPDQVLQGLMKHDKRGGLYLTAVARRLLEDASNRDPGIAGAFQVQTVT